MFIHLNYLVNKALHYTVDTLPNLGCCLMSSFYYVQSQCLQEPMTNILKAEIFVNFEELKAGLWNRCCILQIFTCIRTQGK